MRQQLQLKRDDVADEAGIPRRLYEHLEAGTASLLNEMEAAAKLTPVFRAHGGTITQRWLLGLPEEGNIVRLNLRRAMEAQNITAGMLSNMARVSFSAINALLAGLIPTHHQIDALAAALGLSREALEGQIIPEVEPKPAHEDDDSEILDVIAGRLKAARTAKKMTQTALAEKISKRRGVAIAVSTLNSYVSQIEHGRVTSSIELVLRHSAVILKQEPAWLLAEDLREDQTPKEPDRQVMLLPAPELDIEQIRAQIAQARADIQTTRELLAEQTAGLTELLAEQTQNLEKLELLVEPTMVDAHILAAMQARNHPDLGVSQNGHDKSGNQIDRAAPTKQNAFARKLFGMVDSFRDRELTVSLLKDEMNGVLSDLVPRPEKARSALRHYMERESSAANGIVVPLGGGKWKIRDGVSLQ